VAFSTRYMESQVHPQPLDRGNTVSIDKRSLRLGCRIAAQGTTIGRQEDPMRLLVIKKISKHYQAPSSKMIYNSSLTSRLCTRVSSEMKFKLHKQSSRGNGVQTVTVTHFSMHDHKSSIFFYNNEGKMWIPRTQCLGSWEDSTLIQRHKAFAISRTLEAIFGHFLLFMLKHSHYNLSFPFFLIRKII